MHVYYCTDATNTDSLLGFCMSNNPAMVLEIVGIKNLNTAYGLNAFIGGLALLTAPPLHGMLSKEASLKLYNKWGYLS